MKRATQPAFLHVLLNGRAMGRVDRAGDKLTFTYDGQWQHGGPDIPLSLSMPLAAATHPHERISNFMWGLLADNDDVLRRIGREYGVSPRNPYALLWKIGEDCAGAVQFVAPDRLEEIAQGGGVDFIDENDIAARLAELRHDASTGRREGDRGQYSLAGAQAKTALCLQDGKWGIPHGRVPTTHILKPPLSQFEGHLHNEHFCLRLAAQVDLPAAKSQVMTFGDELAIVVERYDRARVDGHLVRVHQEDMCQALGLHPASKYQSDGGPGMAEVMKLIGGSTTQPDEDRRTFMRAIAFNYLIGGTDAHAKNYGVVFGPGQVRLAPLYDVASYLPYFRWWPDVRMAMKIGGYYQFAKVGRRHWERACKEASYPADAAIADLLDLARNLPDAAATVAASCRKSGIDHPVLTQLTDAIAKRCAEIVGEFAGTTAK